MKRLFFLALLAGAFAFPAKVAGQVNVDILKVENPCCIDSGSTVVLFVAEISGHQHPNWQTLDQIMLRTAVTPGGETPLDGEENTLKNFTDFRLYLNGELLAVYDTAKKSASSIYVNLRHATHIPGAGLATLKVTAKIGSNLNPLKMNGWVTLRPEQTWSYSTTKFENQIVSFATKNLSVKNPDFSKIVMRQNHDDRIITLENLLVGSKVQVFDMKGIIVREISDCKLSETIEFHDLPKGIYVLLIGGTPYRKVGI